MSVTHSQKFPIGPVIDQAEGDKAIIPLHGEGGGILTRLSLWEGGRRMLMGRRWLENIS